MLERRKFIRIPQSTKISYEIANNPRPKSLITRNISEAGISFLADEFIAVGSVLKIQFSLKEFSYDGFAKVVWIMEDTRNERYEIGAQFMSLPRVA
ncbi:MAG: PilZ domain-containing protein [Candidatus Omnitrophota bacterium]|nr:PilZ domain-containing protein [Candidatus Omnitrophota bacterium]